MRVDETLAVDGMPGVWALGDGAAVPNTATLSRLPSAASTAGRCLSPAKYERRRARRLRARPT